MDCTSRKSCPGKSVEHNEILRQITEQLAEIHSRGEIHGKHISSLPEILDSARKLDISNESLSEWRPAEETKTDLKPTKEGDVFSLGCYFYYVITGGQHPFGRSGQRALFIENNLYHLAGCRDQQLQTLIARMISHDCTKRPNSSELLNHPFLWHSEKTEEYLTNVAENIEENSDQYNKWKGIILLSDKSIGVNRGQKKTAVKVTNVAAVLKEIKEKKENPTDLCLMFPNLLPSVYISENTGSNEIEQEIDESRPEIFNDLLVANGSFGEVKLVMKFKRRHGRLGLQHVHVIQFQKDCDDTAPASERLRYLSHPNCLQCFYLVENSLEICMAFEPFNETVETWLEKRERKQLEWEIINGILRQITKGLVHYHTNKITHGNLSLSQIVIFEKESAIVAKVATLDLSHVKYSQETPAATMKNDIRELGQIFSYLLSESRQEISQSHVHLIRAMKELALPSAASVLKHPFLWSPEMTAAFLLAAGDYYVQHPDFDKISKLDTASLALNPDQRNLTTNREALQAFSLQTGNLTLEERKSLVVEWTKQFPKLVLQTWLRLQKFKEVFSDEDLDLSSFYHPNYDFPAYDELINDEKNIDIKSDDGVPPQNLEFGKSEIQSYLADYINWKLSKKDQGTSMPSYITKHIDNLFIRTSPLHVACQSDQYYESANALMDLGFNPDQKDPNGFAPLHVAADKKAVKIVQLLIQNNAKLDIRDEKYQITPIFFAANNNSTQIVALLIQNKAKINQSDPIGRNPLHFAVKNNSLEAAKILLESGADVNARDAFGNSSLHIAVDLNLVEMVKLLLSYEANPNVAFPVILNADNTIGCALHLAVAKHSLEMVKVLLNGGADPNQTNCNGETALHLAAAAHILLSPNRLLIVDLLIKKGAKPNVIDNCGRTVLYNAIFNKVEDVARILLELDCSVAVLNQRENKAGLAPLHLAAWHKFENIARMLIAKKAKIDITDENGLTPLEYAAASNAVNVAKRLLESDAEAISRFQTKNIRSPLHVAAAYDALEVGILFISKGADIHSIDGLGLTPLHYATYRKSTRFIEFLKAKQENCPNASADVSDEPDLRKPKRNSKRYRNQQRRHQQPQERDNSQERKQQQNQTPYLSKNLSPEELASIPQLIDCFKVISSDIPNFQINRPSYETQFPNITLTITQVTNFPPGYV